VPLSRGAGCQATGSRVCIGRRKMSAKAAATGARHAQAVVASACVGGRLAKAEKKIVPSAATPSALDSCWTASSTPEAEPISSIPTPARMNSNSCPIDVPAPAPIRNSPGARSSVEAVCVPVTVRARTTVPTAVIATPRWSR
jgi:hypothetical protein